MKRQPVNGLESMPWGNDQENGLRRKGERVKRVYNNITVCGHTVVTLWSHDSHINIIYVMIKC